MPLCRGISTGKAGRCTRAVGLVGAAGTCERGVRMPPPTRWCSPARALGGSCYSSVVATVASGRYPVDMSTPARPRVDALQRELAEETGVDVSALAPRIVERTLVDDPRATDHAWIATTVGVYQLDEPVTPHAGDDAVEGRWWPAASLVALTTALTEASEQLYAAHRDVLTVALGPADA
jgi:8-oxo-dGTP pyrophosphatase MutT (NUDIX family)